MTTQLAKTTAAIYRYGRRSNEELQPWITTLDNHHISGTGGFRLTKQQRQFDQLVFADFLADENDPREALVRADATHKSDPRFHNENEYADMHQLVYTIGHNYDNSEPSGLYHLHKSNDGRYILGWWPKGLTYGFIAELPPEQLYAIADQFENPEHRSGMQSHLPKTNTNTKPELPK